MNLFILRHGETEYNRLGLIQGSGIDSELNETGRRQARSFFDRYQHIPFQLVVTSALRRTHQTVEPFLIEKNIPWIQTADINEISWGDQEGIAPDEAYLETYRALIHDWNTGKLDSRIPGGESANELGHRLSRFLEWLSHRPEQNILICSHGRTMRALIAMMKGISLAEMEGVRHANTGCYVVQKLDTSLFHFERENCTLHLSPLPQD